MSEFEPRYSGSQRSGICKCGHSWKKHHLGIILNVDYRVATGEIYLPQECEFFGFNETGGLQQIEGTWENHCQAYRDSLEAA